MARRAWGEGTIHRRKDGSFEGKISLGVVDGKRVRRTIYGQSKREVSEALRDLTLRQHGANANVSLAEFLEDWLSDGKENRNWAINTCRLRETIIRKHLVPYLGSRRLCDIDIPDIKALLRRWADDGTGSAIRVKAFKTLSGALNTAYREQTIYRNPCVFVSAPKHKRKKMVLLTEEQALLLMTQAEPLWLGALLTLAIMTAIRKGELFALRWKNIDFQRKTIEVTATVVDDAAYTPTEGPPKRRPLGVRSRLRHAPLLR